MIEHTEPDDTIDTDDTIGAPPQPPPPKPVIAAWCSRPSVRDLTVAKQTGITELHLMIHDDSTDRRPSKFEIDKYADEYCRRIIDAGFALHLTAWAQPHRDYLLAACEWLTEASVRHGVRSICWDAEEPWTQAIGGMDPVAAAALIDLAGAVEGVTGIGYAPRSIDPLLARADYVAPQVYVTARERSLRAESVPTVLERWAARSCATVIPALAAYAQHPGGMVAAWHAAKQPRSVILWSLRHVVRNSAETRKLARAMGVMDGAA